MKIAVYMNDFIYKYGGAESYAANLISVLQKIFSNDVITVITEYYRDDGVIINKVQDGIVETSTGKSYMPIGSGKTQMYVPMDL